MEINLAIDRKTVYILLCNNNIMSKLYVIICMKKIRVKMESDQKNI